MVTFGLVGYPLGHSFSKKYFKEKFAREGLQDHNYQLFELPDIAELPGLLAQHPNLRGFNVTIPHKQSILPFLDELDPVAAKIGAVNTVKIAHARLIGYNTDWLGFRQSLRNFLPDNFRSDALILGTGGSAQAVKAALSALGIAYSSVSRVMGHADLTYANCTESVVSRHRLIINTTPLGMAPRLETFPDLPYQAIGPDHYLFDLVYNPPETLFLRMGKREGAQVKNGLEMLHLQAEAAWNIWMGNTHS